MQSEIAPIQHETPTIQREETTPEAPNIPDLKKEERDRILSLLELTDNIKELRFYIENNMEPSHAALEMVKKMKKKPVEIRLPNPVMANGGVSRAQETLNIAKKLGVF